MSVNAIKSAALAIALAAVPTISAGVFSPEPVQATGSSRMLLPNSPAAPKIVAADGSMTPDHEMVAPYFQGISTVGSLLGPDGEDWFYTLELDTEIVSQSPYYTEYDYTGFKITVYDSNLTPVGKAGATIQRPEGTAKCQSINVVENVTLTSHFFDTDASTFEVMISANFNPGPDTNGNPRYGAKQATQVYTLTPEIPEDGSRELFRADGVLHTALTDAGIMAFSHETTWDGENTSEGIYTIYRAATDGNGPAEAYKFSVNVAMAMQDGVNEGAPFLICKHGSDVYIALATLRKQFLVDPTASTPEQTPDNSYIIDLYKLTDAGIETVSQTVIPFAAPAGDFLYRSYAVGNFRGDGDITFDFSTDGSPCFIITVVDSNNQDDTDAYYAVYDVNGNEVKRFGAASAGFIAFSSLPGRPDQYGFEMYDDSGEYGYVLVDYPSLSQVGRLQPLFEHDGDIWEIISIPDRTVSNGEVLYVCSVMPYGGATEDVDHYVGWFRADGSIHHIDSLSFGENAAKILTYVHPSVLDPHLFNSNDDYEYIAWVYRWKENASGTTLELAVADSRGQVLASRPLPDSRAFENAYVSNSKTNPFIVLSYRDIVPGSDYNPMRIEFIRLPLDATGIDAITADRPASPDATVTDIYTISGRLITTTADLPAGLYILRYSDGTARKIAK